jgi:hypothetical protein
MTTPSETRISTLVGDRLCIKCGYNLVGQPIFREEHYGMFIVRCPECATVASLQEYPLLGRWANRWASLLAGIWMLIIVALWLGSSAAIFGLSLGAAEVACERYSDELYQQFNAWQAQSATPGGGGAGTVTRTRGQVVIVNNTFTNFSTWWAQQDPSALLAEAGGFFGGIDVWVWYLWFWEAVVAIALGVMWATILLGRKRPGLIVVAIMIMLGAASLSAIPLIDWLQEQPQWMYQASRSQIGPRALAISLAWGGACLVMGLMIGRPVTRGLMRLMLPPRLRSSLAFLWLADGKNPPGVANTRRA